MTNPGTGKKPRKTGKVLALVIALPIIGGLALLATRDHGLGRVGVHGEDQQLPHHEAGPESPPPSLLSPASADDPGKRADAALADWRTGILIRDADKVVRLDAAFLEAPAMFLDGLKKSAASDENERVRAFSTRELGKFKRVELAATFERLLKDGSPFVRKNAAWALGELCGGDEGRAAAQHARAELLQVARRDPAEDVRAAARTTLQRIE